MKKSLMMMVACLVLAGGNAFTQNHFGCDELFIQAVRNRDEAGVREHLGHSWGNLNYRDKAGKTGLMYAVEMGSIPMVDLLLNANKAVCDPNVEDSEGRTALMYAIKRNDLALVMRLLEDGSNVNVNYQTKTTRDTALHYAVDTNMKNIVKVLLENKTISTSIVDINDYTAFMIAIKNGNTDMITLFGNSPHFDVTMRPANSDIPPPLLFAIEKKMPLTAIEAIIDTCRNAMDSVDRKGNGPLDYQDIYSRSRTYDDDLKDILDAAEARRRKARR
jgi:ankyrin repeat protein